MSVAICGAASSIAERFVKIVMDKHPNESVVTGRVEAIPTNHDRYLICTGYLAGKALFNQTREELISSFELNYALVAGKCEMIFNANPLARICVLGSHSGIEGSFDMAYAGAKAAIHLYVERKVLGSPQQMLVALAPHIVWDSAMTQRRNDLEALAARGAKTRLGRWINSEEVARMAFDVLYRWPTCCSGQVIRMRAE